MKKLLSLCFFILLTLAPLNAQSVLAGWEGDYEGVMIVGSTSNPNDSVGVKFEFQPLESDSVWTYKLTFDSRRFGIVVKDYLVRRVGESKTDFVLDEQDGIIIEMSLMNDCFYDMFEVMDNLYTTTLRKFEDEVLFDLFMSSMKKGTITESEADEEGNVFEVTSYKPSLHQTIKLKKIR